MDNRTLSGQSDSKYLVVSDQPTLKEAQSISWHNNHYAYYIKNCLNAAGITFTDCLWYYLTPIPQSIDELITVPKSLKKANPHWSDMGQARIEELRRVISVSENVKVIYAVGEAVTFALTGRWGIHNWRGSPIPCLFNKDIIVIPLLSQSFMAVMEEYNRVFVSDLIKGRLIIESDGKILREPTCIIRPSFSDCLEYLEYCISQGRRGTQIAFDIECKHGELNCFSISPNEIEAMSIPLMDGVRSCWTLDEEFEVISRLKVLLEDRQIQILGQNLTFDTHFMLRKYAICTSSIDDTMIAQHTLFHDLPKGLDMINSLYTMIPYYKADGKEWFDGGGTMEKLWRYNCLDSVVCKQAWPKQLSMLAKTDNLITYNRQRDIILPCVYMMERGIKVDMNLISLEAQKLQNESDIARTSFTAIAPNINPQSPKQLSEYLYKTLRLPAIKNKKGVVTTDALALSKLVAEGVQEAALITRIRRADKIRNTYFAPHKFDSDSRIRCSYNPAGTAWSRLSSSENIFGTGMNMQNWPHDALKSLKADDGYVIYQFDLSQAENRIVAYVGNIAPMIEAFETGKDVHSVTAGLIFEKDPSEISDEEGSCTLGGGKYSERFWGKKANHSLNYDFSPHSFSLLYEIPLKDAIRIYDGYHKKAYPGVKAGFHAYVKRCLQANRTLVNLKGRATYYSGRMGDNLFKAAYACIPQGTVGDIINEHGMSYIYYNNDLFKNVELLVQIHDSIGFQIPTSLPWDEHAIILQSIKNSLESTLTTHYGRSFVIPADLAMGLCLRKESGIEIKAKKWPKSLSDLSDTLRENYSRLLTKEY